MPGPERRTPPGEGGVHHIAPQRLDSTNDSRRDRCLLGCSPSCAYVCPVPIDLAVTELIFDLLVSS